MSKWLAVAAVAQASRPSQPRGSRPHRNSRSRLVTRPRISPPGTDGKTHKLSDTRARLSSSPGSQRPAPLAERPNAGRSVRAAKRFEYDVAYFMISVDTLKTNKAFAEKEQADFPMLSNPDKTVAEAYGVLPPVNPDRPDVGRDMRADGRSSSDPTARFCTSRRWATRPTPASSSRRSSKSWASRRSSALVRRKDRARRRRGVHGFCVLAADPGTSNQVVDPIARYREWFAAAAAAGGLNRRPRVFPRSTTTAGRRAA